MIAQHTNQFQQCPCIAIFSSLVLLLLCLASTAAIETTLWSIEWAIAELVNHPEIQQKLRQELDAERAGQRGHAHDRAPAAGEAVAQMEACQFKCYTDWKREVQEELASLSELTASYHSRL